MNTASAAALPNPQSLLANLFQANAASHALDTQFKVEGSRARDNIMAISSNCCSCRGTSPDDPVGTPSNP